MDPGWEANLEILKRRESMWMVSVWGTITLPSVPDLENQTNGNPSTVQADLRRGQDKTSEQKGEKKKK